MAVVGIEGHEALKGMMDPPKRLKATKSESVNPLMRKRIGVLNLMPNKLQTEIQYLNLFSPCEALIDLVWIKQTSRVSKNVDEAHLNAYYQNYADASQQGLDALIITGAPIEHLDFEDVAYWKEIIEIFEDNAQKRRPTLFICWAAQAALYYFYKVQKIALKQKLFGVFEHKKTHDDWILSDVKTSVYAPHSRYTTNCREAIREVSHLKILLDSEEAGVFMVRDTDKPYLYLTGHIEYDTQALDREYKRDLNKGLSIDLPKRYYVNNNPELGIENKWQDQSLKIIKRWVNTL
jgi:homoserine O-succinyltransferase/O-acetyltransferase